jgi:dolichol-phosphate mannosyltransferase
MNSDLSISIILPCYNERGNIPFLVDTIHSVLKDIRHEIIVVDDNSPDGTHSLVLCMGYPFVVALKNNSTKGLGRCVRLGIEYAKYNLIAVMDSDNEHNPEYLKDMISLIETHDCVCASRFLRGAGMTNRLHQLLSFIFNAFIRIMTKSKIRDNLYGYFLIKKQVLKRLNYDYIFYGYGDYYIRLLYYIQRLKIKICEIPAVHGKRKYGSSKTAFFKVLAIYVYAVIDLVKKEKQKIV